MELDKESMEVLNTVLRNAPPLSDDDLASGVQTKKHSKPKKKDSSFLYGNEMAEILKSAQSSEQKLKAVCDKYSETLHANRKLMMANKIAESKIVQLQQENKQCQQQRSKAVLTRSRLENLCRELQKLNKAQKEEIDLKLRLEEEKRKEISATFQSAFAEMNSLTNQNTEKNTKMREENLEMREKIKSVRERVELSQQELDEVRQHAQVELQLAEAKMAILKAEMNAERECLLKEKQQLLLKLTEYQVRISELQATEVGLRSQISMYTEKYDDFQNALTKSNELFSGFNEEMEKMSKKILKLEKETSLWKQRWEKSHAALLEMAADKQARDAEMGKLTHKLSLLQELCKAFQRERSELLAQLRATTSTTTTSSVNNIKNDKDDIKGDDQLSADCQQLKDDLAHLQDSFTEQENQIKSVEPTKSTTDKLNNLTEFNQTEFGTCVNIESNFQASDDNEVAEKQTIKCVEEKKHYDELNNQNINCEESTELNDQAEQSKSEVKTPFNKNESNDIDVIFPNESPESPPLNTNQTIIEVVQCKENMELCIKKCTDEQVDTLVTSLNQVEIKENENSQNVKRTEENVKSKTNSTTDSRNEHLNTESNSNTCTTTEDKKESITKQNSSNSTKKSNGKKKKK